MAERKGSRSRIRLGEVLYVLMSIAIVVLAVIAFSDLQKNRFLFPWIFAVASAMSFFELFHQIRNAPRGRKNWLATIAPLVIALALLLLAGISSVVLI